MSVRVPRAPAAALAILACGLVGAGCGPRHPVLPSGPGTPFPDYAGAFGEASAPCAGVRTLVAELAISGRVAGQRVRGRVLAGVERPDALRLEGVAPFGAPLFILVARGGEATLLLPRDRRVLRGEPPAEVLDALAGVPLTPGDLLAVLAGCVAARDLPLGGRRLDDRWARVDFPDETAVYLRATNGRWRIEAGRIARLVVEYADFDGGGRPSTVTLAVEPEAGPGDRTTLRVRLSQVDVNTIIDPAAFSVIVPRDAEPLSLAELRRSGLLR